MEGSDQLTSAIHRLRMNFLQDLEEICEKAGGFKEIRLHTKCHRTGSQSICVLVYVGGKMAQSFSLAHIH